MQSEFINSTNVLEYDQEPMYTDVGRLSEVIPCQKKQVICEEAKATLYGTRVEFELGSERMICDFSEIVAMAVLGRNKLNIYHDDKIYQYKGGKRFNALKYVHIYHRHKNIVKGEENAKFLGL